MDSLPFSDDRPWFDVTTLSTWAAWSDACASILDRNENATPPARPPAPATDEALASLTAAFVPLFRELSARHHTARNAWLRLENVPFAYQGDAQRYRAELGEQQERARTIADQLVKEVSLALHAGLFDVVLDILAQTVPAPADPTVFPSSSSRHGGRTGPGPDVVTVWDLIPGPSVGVLMVQAAVGHAPFQASSSQIQDHLQRLTQGWAGQEFWSGWKSHLRAFPRPGHYLWCNQLAEIMGQQIATLTRQPALTGLCAAMFERLVESQSMGDANAPWREMGPAILKGIRENAPRFEKMAKGTSTDLLAVLPVNAWLVIAQQTPLTEGVGQWLDEHLMPIAQKDPQGLAAETLCLNAWAGLNRDRILHLEAEVPGIHRRHLDRLPQSVQVFDMVDPCNTPNAQWALPLLEAAGVVPRGSESFDLCSWIVQNPSVAMPTLHALFNQMEAQMLRTSLANDALPRLIRPHRL